jgi:hypothetical protein
MPPLVVNAALGMMAQNPSVTGRSAGLAGGAGARGAEARAGGAGGAGGAGAAEEGAAEMPRDLPRGVPIGLPREKKTLEVPIEITEFQGVVQTLLRQYFYPVLTNLPREVSGLVLNELFQTLDSIIGDKLESYILQLSSRTMPEEVVFDISEFETFIREHTAVLPSERVRRTITELMVQQQRTAPLIKNVEMPFEPSRLDRLRAFISGTTPAPTGISTSLASLAAGLAAAPAAVPAPAVPAAVPAPAGPLPPAAAVPAAAPPAAVPAGPLPPPGAPAPGADLLLPTEERVRKRIALEVELENKQIQLAREYIKKFHVSQPRVDQTPETMKLLYAKFYQRLINLTSVLIITITNRFKTHAEPLSRTLSTQYSQRYRIERGLNPELTLDNIDGYLSREEIEYILQQLIVLIVNYLNISETFTNLLPLVKQIYIVSTLYISIADIDTERFQAGEGRKFEKTMETLLSKLVIDIHKETYLSMRQYLITADETVGSGGIFGRLQHLKESIIGFISPQTRAEVNIDAELGTAAGVSVTIPSRTEMSGTVAGILTDMSHPVMAGFNGLINTTDPAAIREVLNATDEVRRSRMTWSERTVESGLNAGSAVAEVAMDILSRIANATHERLLRVRAGPLANMCVNGLCELDEASEKYIKEKFLEKLENPGSEQRVVLCLAGAYTTFEVHMGARDLYRALSLDLNPAGRQEAHPYEGNVLRGVRMGDEATGNFTAGPGTRKIVKAKRPVHPVLDPRVAGAVLPALPPDPLNLAGIESTSPGEMNRSVTEQTEPNIQSQNIESQGTIINENEDPPPPPVLGRSKSIFGQNNGGPPIFGQNNEDLPIFLTKRAP